MSHLKLSCACIPSFRLDTPGVYLAKVPFLAVFFYSRKGILRLPYSKIQKKRTLGEGYHILLVNFSCMKEHH